MKIIYNLNQLKKMRKPIVAAAGFFDGIHLGHRKVIEHAIMHADKIGGSPWVITFQTHPMRILNPAAAPPLLTATEHKLRILARMNITGCLLLPFDKNIAGKSPESFINDLLAVTPPLRELVVGQNWRFGNKGKGSPRMISRLAGDSNLSVSIVRPKIWKGAPISSTRIRTAVLRGNIEEATAMLGRPFSILGTVQHGSGIGHSLGFPTANLNAHHEVLPPYGVYAAYMMINTSGNPTSRKQKNKIYNGILNFGIRPTFGDNSPENAVLELHIFDFNQNIYNTDIEIFFVEKIRDEKKFNSATELKKQINRDIETAEKILRAIR